MCYNKLMLLAIIIVLSANFNVKMCENVPNPATYLEERKKLLFEESKLLLGGQISLSEKEEMVNKILVNEKLKELDEGYRNSSNFLPSRHFFESKKLIDDSSTFLIIKRAPKGASLHTHLLAAVSVDFIINNMTYRDNLYGCFMNDTFKLRYLASSVDDDRCIWKELKEYRKEDPNFDDWLRTQLTLERENYKEVYSTIETVWKFFKKIFTTTYEMLCHRPVFQDYIYQLLHELYLDNIFYTELKGTVMPLYELNGSVYSNQQFFEIFQETVENFKTTHPKFLQVRYIHSIYRGISRENLKTNLSDLIELKKLFPKFIAGIDFVGFEDEGGFLVNFHQELLAVYRNDLDFYFHAGETKWFGYTDLNLVDAILLKSKRIGHGIALSKHPLLLELARNEDIAVEISPISNQVLMLHEDPRSHPSTHLVATGFPVVVCNDDPSAWGATGLSYDWYVAFMAMTSRNDGLRVLKQLALNSIHYSAMEEAEKGVAYRQFKLAWDEFLDDVIRKWS